MNEPRSRRFRGGARPIEFQPFRLREAIVQVDLRPTDVASYLGVRERTVLLWLAGRTTPGGANLIGLADLLDRPCEFFFTRRFDVAEEEAVA